MRPATRVASHRDLTSREPVGIHASTRPLGPVISRYRPPVTVGDGGGGMDVRRVLRALSRGVGAALAGGLIGAVLTRALMRLIMVVAGGTTTFTWSGLAFIAIFYVVFLAPGAVAIAWSRDRWPLFVFGAGALAIPVQAAGIATTDLEAVRPLSAGQWVVLSVLFLGMAAVYALQAAIAYRVARSARRDAQVDPSTLPAGAHQVT